MVPLTLVCSVCTRWAECSASLSVPNCTTYIELKVRAARGRKFSMNRLFCTPAAATAGWAICSITARTPTRGTRMSFVYLHMALPGPKMPSTSPAAVARS